MLGQALQEYLNPPQQDYKMLGKKLSELESDDPLEQVLKDYFQTFANGYFFWQVNYDYPRVHEYFFSACLAACRRVNALGGRLLMRYQAELPVFLNAFSRAFIHYSLCENAMLTASHFALQENAKWAHEHAVEALNHLEELDLPEELDTPLRVYLDMNDTLFQGLILCSRLYLAGRGVTEYVNQIEQIAAEVQNLLNQLRQQSRELFSELRSHFSVSLRLARAYQSRDQSRLRVRQADVTLRTTAFIDPRLTAAIFDQFQEDGSGSHIHEMVTGPFGLPVEDVYSEGFMDDSFLTEMALPFLDALRLELPAGEESLRLTLYDGLEQITYSPDTWIVDISRAGVMSVNIALCVGDCGQNEPHTVSISHMRTLAALVGPQAGTMEVIWTQPPTEIPDDPFRKPESTNFVLAFLRCQAWLADIEADTSLVIHNRATYQELQARMRDFESYLTDLSANLSNPALESPYAQDGKLVFAAEYRSLQTAFEDIVDLLHGDLLEPHASDTLAEREIKNRGRDIFPRGRIVSNVMQINQEIISRVAEALRKLALERGALAEGDQVWLWFNPDANWQTITVCNRLAIEYQGRPAISDDEPALPNVLEKLTGHVEFKGFALPPREAACLDDWMFAAVQPDLRNLARIDSLGNHVVYSGPNRAFIYKPDSPQYITDIDVTFARLMGDLRTYVLAHHTENKAFISRVGGALKDLHELTGVEQREQLATLRDELQRWRYQVNRAFAAVRDLTINKYENSSRMIRAMVETTQVDHLHKMLSESTAELDQLYSYVVDLLRQSA